MEPRALRRGLRGADLAEGLRRRRRAVHAPGDLPRGDGAGRGAAAHRRHRRRHGRPDDHGARHRGAEGALPRADPLRRGDLVPGVLGAGGRFGPRGRQDERAPGGRPLRRRRPEGVVVVRAHRRPLHPPHPQRPRLDAPRRAHVPDRGHESARRGSAAADADHGRGRVQRDLLHRRPCPRREPPRRGRRRVAGRDDDAPARAGDARLRAPGRARGADPEARRTRARPWRRPDPARQDRARVDRDAGAPLHELPLALAAREDGDARAGGVDLEARVVGGEPARDEARARAPRPRRAALGRERAVRRLLAVPAAPKPREHDRGRDLGGAPQHRRRARARPPQVDVVR